MNEYLYDDIIIGKEESFSVTVTQEMMDSFMQTTGDVNPLHSDESYAKEMGFKSKVVFGMLTASFLSTLAGVYLPGKYCLIHAVSIDFSSPVFVGDKLKISGIVTEKDDRFKTVDVKIMIRNSSNAKVCRGKMKLGVLA